MKRLFVSVVIGVLGFAAHGNNPAKACINGVEEERREWEQSQPPYIINVADKNLDSGYFTIAANTVLNIVPNIRNLDARSTTPIFRRGMRVLSLAITRLGPKSEGIGGWTKSANLAWAETTLAEIEEARNHEPAARADHAEALASLPRDHDIALKTLEELDQKDLMGSVNAYMALATLRLEQGDEGGMRAAVRRCHAMSSARDRCMLPAAVKKTT